MAYGIRDGDIISLDNPKAGALTMSVPFQDYQDRTEVTPENMWRTMTAVRSVVNFKAKSIAGVPFQLYEREPDGGRDKVRDSDLARTLKTPMPRMGQTRFVEQLMFDMSIYGRWMFLVEPAEVGYKFLRLPAEKCAIGISPAGEYDRLWISTGDGWKWVPLDNVVFDISFGPTPRGGKARGWSDVDTLGELALELTQLGDYRRELFKNQAMVPAVVERPAGKQWSDEAWKRFKTDIASYRSGGPNAGGWPVLEDGMQLKPIQVMDPSKAEYVQVRELSLTEAAQALNIPPELVGAREGTNSNILALREQLYVDVLGPDISSFQEALNAGLEKFMTPDQYIEVNFDAKLRGSLNDRAKIYQSAGGAPWLTVNEIRAMENRPTLEGGDELIRPMNVTEGGQANPQDSAPDDNGQDEKDGTLSREPDRKAVEPRPKVRGRSAAHRITADHFDELNKACETYEQNLLDFWHGYTKRMARRMGIDLKGRDHRGKAIPVYPGTDILRAETALLEGTILSSSRVVAKAGSDLVLNNWNPDMTGFAYDKQENWLKKVAKTASGQFEHQMAKTYADGLGQDMNNWGDAIAEQYNDDAGFMSWATGGATETASFAGEDAARASGVTHKRWVTQSKNPRDSHKGQSGMLIEIDDYFPNGCRYPGDWEGGADEVVNCSCRLDYEKPNELHPSPLKEIGQTLFQNFLVPAVESYLAPALAPGTYPMLTSGTGTALETFNMLAIGGRPVLPLEAAASFSDNQIDSFLRYTLGESEQVNAALRGGSALGIGAEVAELTKTLRGALKNQRFQEDTFLQRRMPAEALGGALDKVGGDWDKLKGLTIRDEAFMSTSEFGVDVSPGVYGNTTLNIMAPKGTRGAYIGEYSYMGDKEREMLLAPGNSMEILDVHKNKDGTFELDVVLDQDGA